MKMWTRPRTDTNAEYQAPAIGDPSAAMWHGLVCCGFLVSPPSETLVRPCCNIVDHIYKYLLAAVSITFRPERWARAWWSSIARHQATCSPSPEPSSVDPAPFRRARPCRFPHHFLPMHAARDSSPFGSSTPKV